MTDQMFSDVGFPSSDIESDTTNFWQLMDQHVDDVSPRHWCAFDIWEAYKLFCPDKAASHATSCDVEAPRFQPTRFAKHGSLQTRKTCR